MLRAWLTRGCVSRGDDDSQRLAYFAHVTKYDRTTHDKPHAFSAVLFLVQARHSQSRARCSCRFSPILLLPMLRFCRCLIRNKTVFSNWTFACLIFKVNLIWGACLVDRLYNDDGKQQIYTFRFFLKSPFMFRVDPGNFLMHRKVFSFIMPTELSRDLCYFNRLEIPM